MSFKENKVVMACRIAPDMKEMLEQEANDNGLTLSAYMEDVISKRELITQSEFWEGENEKLKVSLEQETRVNKRLLTENERLRNENVNFKQYSQRFEQINWLSEEDITTLLHSLSALGNKLPQFNKRQLLLGVLQNAVSNEKNRFEILKLKDFFKENPNFLTSKLKQNETHLL